MAWYQNQCRHHFVYVPNQWETTLQCDVISQWLGTYTKWSLSMFTKVHDDTYGTHKRPQINGLVQDCSNSSALGQDIRCEYFGWKWQWTELEDNINQNLRWKQFSTSSCVATQHDDVMPWTHSPHYWPFVLRIHIFMMNSQHKGSVMQKFVEPG